MSASLRPPGRRHGVPGQRHPHTGQAAPCRSRPGAWPWRGTDGCLLPYRSTGEPAIPSHSPQITCPPRHPPPLLNSNAARGYTPLRKACPCLSPSPRLTVRASPPFSTATVPPAVTPFHPGRHSLPFSLGRVGSRHPTSFPFALEQGKGRGRTTSSPPTADRSNRKRETRGVFFSARTVRGLSVESGSRLPSKANLPRGQPLGLSLCVATFPKALALYEGPSAL